MSVRRENKTRDEIHVDLEDPVPLLTWDRTYLSGVSRRGWGSGVNRPYSSPGLEGGPATVVYLILAMFLAVVAVAVLLFIGVL